MVWEDQRKRLDYSVRLQGLFLYWDRLACRAAHQSMCNGPQLRQSMAWSRQTCQDAVGEHREQILLVSLPRDAAVRDGAASATRRFAAARPHGSLAALSRPKVDGSPNLLEGHEYIKKSLLVPNV